jgi:hypothetical protein
MLDRVERARGSMMAVTGPQVRLQKHVGDSTGAEVQYPSKRSPILRLPFDTIWAKKIMVCSRSFQNMESWQLEAVMK